MFCFLWHNTPRYILYLPNIFVCSVFFDTIPLIIVCIYLIYLYVLFSLTQYPSLYSISTWYICMFCFLRHNTSHYILYLSYIIVWFVSVFVAIHIFTPLSCGYYSLHKFWLLHEYFYATHNFKNDTWCPALPHVWLWCHKQVSILCSLFTKLKLCDFIVQTKSRYRLANMW
jgi:hypothetical protein